MIWKNAWIGYDSEKRNKNANKIGARREMVFHLPKFNMDITSPPSCILIIDALPCLSLIPTSIHRSSGE